MSSVFSGCDFAAGWASGVLSLLVGHPLDTVKVWSQTLPEKSSSLKIIGYIYKHDGITGYYKGMMFPLLSTGALNALFFGVYGNALRQLQNMRGVEQTMCWFKEKPYAEWYWDILLAGSLGGIACSFITCPVELIKTQMQTQTDQRKGKVFGRSTTFRNPWECFMYQFKMNGLKGLYKGFVPLLWRDIPGSGIYVLAYEWFICHRGENRSQTHRAAVMNYVLGGALAGSYGLYMVVYVDSCRRLGSDKSSYVMLAGATAGIISWVPVVPFDVIKNRIQADDYTNRKYNGMWDCMLKSYQVEGVSVFFRGFWLIALRSIPVNAVVFVGYEFFISFSFGIMFDVVASGVYMLVYTQTCQYLSAKQHWSIMLAGANAGMWSWIVVVPLDVVKNRIQADSRSHPRYKGMMDCAVKSYLADGPLVFFRGFWLIVLRSWPVNAVTFVGYEFFMSFCS